MQRNIALTDLMDDAHQLTSRAFEEKYGAAFLLQSTTPPEDENKALDATTLAQGKAFAKNGSLLDSLVHPVRRVVTSRFGGEYISVGRSDTNSIAINHTAVSKFHAFFLEKGQGAFAISDAGSKNGTFLNDEPVPNYREKNPPLVKPGDRVRFGDVKLTFMSADEIRTLAKRAKKEA